MGDAARDEHERAHRGVDPLVSDEDAHGAPDDVEHIVLGVRVRAGPLGVRLEPPLGDRVRPRGLVAVCLEHRADPAHRIITTLTGAQDDGAACWLAPFHATSSPMAGRRPRWAYGWSGGWVE